MSQDIEQHILKRYQVVKKVGSGAYGNVWKVIDKKTKDVLALKKIFDAFQHSTDAQRTYREIMYLREFDHDNIIKLHQVYRAENDKDIYLIFQFMEADLHNVIRENILQDIHKQYILYQIGLALKYLHSGQVIHRDLKPSNILLNSECLVKLCDFGLIRSIAKTDKNCPVLTENVATRWYRAPQILLGSNDYTKQVDMWSLGCIVGEIILGKPMFPGNSTLNQLEKIISFTGKPTQQDLESMKSDLAKSMIQSIPPVKVKTIKQWFPYAATEMVELVVKLLQFNPSKRLNCDKLLKLPYLLKFHGKGNQSVAKNIFQIKNDQQKLTTKDYRNLIYDSLKQDINTKFQNLSFKQQLKKSSSPVISVKQKPVQKQTLSATNSNSSNNVQNNLSDFKPQKPKSPMLFKPTSIINNNSFIPSSNYSTNIKHQKFNTEPTDTAEDNIIIGKQKKFIIPTRKNNSVKIQQQNPIPVYSSKLNYTSSNSKPNHNSSNSNEGIANLIGKNPLSPTYIPTKFIYEQQVQTNQSSYNNNLIVNKPSSPSLLGNSSSSGIKIGPKGYQDAFSTIVNSGNKNIEMNPSNSIKYIKPNYQISYLMKKNNQNNSNN